MSEQDLQHAILEYLRASKCYAVKVPSGSARGEYGEYVALAPAGTPDILCSRPDKMFGCVEVKSPGGRLRDTQIAALRAIHALGLAWLVADDMEDVAWWIKDPGYHGKEKYTKLVTDESTKYIFQKTRSKKLTMNDFLGYNQFLDDKKKT